MKLRFNKKDKKDEKKNNNKKINKEKSPKKSVSPNEVRINLVNYILN
jgi:hypothetical protein